MTTTDVPEPVAGLLDAVNRHDEEAFLDAFTSDGFVDDWGRTFTGREAIDGWSGKELIGARGHLAVQSVETNAAGEVVVVGDWRSEYANGLSRFTFVVDGDQVASMTIREG
ncbi:MAG: nuclear transport factor 2 family protein [Nocardioidaceae bacterium]|nr:nuclear transport factor 2 family protein [Nocardioidaceae bacterium]